MREKYLEQMTLGERSIDEEFVNESIIGEEHIEETTRKERVLVVDDENIIAMGISHSLTKDDIMVDVASDNVDALNLAKENEYNLILLDTVLGDVDGFQVCRQIREFSNAPIAMLTNCPEDIEKVHSMEYGADDYIAKPFSILDVKARIKNIIKKMAEKESNRHDKLLIRGKIKIDFESKSVMVGDLDIDLTANEFGLLELLILNPGKVYSRDNLLSLVWGAGYPGDARTVDVHIRRLREKIEKDSGTSQYIHTKWGGGYYFRD